MVHVNVEKVSRLVMALVVTSSLAAQSPIHVDGQAAGANDGTTWADAFVDLQSALEVAVAGSVIRVAHGTYGPSKPSINDIPESASFELVDGAALLGGFGGITHSDPDARDPKLYETILDGHAAVAGSTWGVLTANGVTESTVVDGFTIRNGSAGPFGTGGGGLRVVGGHLTVRSCKFEDNTAWAAGGAISLYGGALTVSACRFEGNGTVLAPGVGGAIVVTGDLVASDCVFSGNRATWGEGGAIAVSGALIAERCDFEFNSAMFAGGAISTTMDATLVDCRFQNDGCGASSLSSPGGVGGRGGAVDAGGALLALRCDFIDNVAIGALYPTTDTPGKGGAVGLVDAVASIANCRFLGNAAVSSFHNGGEGGAVYAEGSDVTLTSCLFSGNTAYAGYWEFTQDPALGGALSVSSGTATVANCTVAGNSIEVLYHGIDGHGGGIFGDCTVVNSILWGNSDPSGSGEAAQLAGATQMVNFSCIQGLTGSLGGVGNTGADPIFLDPAGKDGDAGTEDDNLQTEGGTPCRDSGDNGAVSADVADLDLDGDTAEPMPLDLDGTGRFADDVSMPDKGVGATPVVDMGCYEHSAWRNLGSSLSGIAGAPVLVGHGPLVRNTVAQIVVTNVAPGAGGFLLGGTHALNAPFKGGSVVPDPYSLGGFAWPVLADASGALSVDDRWPPGTHSGFTIYLQVWMVDPSAPLGVQASNAVLGVTP